MLTVAASVTGVELVAAPTAVLGLTYTVTDTDLYITQASVTVTWGDGQAEAAVVGALPLGPTTLGHGYLPGSYVLVVRAVNYRSPLADTASFTQVVTVTRATATAPATTTPVVSGPILPRDEGFPGAAVWDHNVAHDGLVLESSLRMLLLTRRGERVCDPTYGTSLGALVFSPSTDDLPALVRDEITRAVAAHEPRVEFVNCSVSRSGRDVYVLAEFRSLLSQQPLVLNLGFAA
jgi:phage baseplate assembly protein W